MAERADDIDLRLRDRGLKAVSAHGRNLHLLVRRERNRVGLIIVGVDAKRFFAQRVLVDLNFVERPVNPEASQQTELLLHNA